MKSGLEGEDGEAVRKLLQSYRQEVKRIPNGAEAEGQKSRLVGIRLGRTQGLCWVEWFGELAIMLT